MYEKQYEIPVNETGPFPATLTDQIACAPFEEYLGMKIDKSDQSGTDMSMPFNVKLAQSKGLMHGGAIASLAHTTLAVAIKKQLPVGSDIEIITFSLRFHLPVRGGMVRASGKVVEETERDIRGEVLVYNCHGEKAATFSAAYRKERARKLV
ncbi:MAG TPA: PaaI family thioesterase [Geomobilimonas sp.]|nr:PaaI family thioesterase [Geomobilimonas sp.]